MKLSEKMLVNRLLSPQVFNKISHSWLKKKIKEGKVFLIDGYYLIDENGKHRAYLQSSGQGEK